jgi:signal transduction histidine kinase
MDYLLFQSSVQLPVVNRLAIIAINFAALTLLFTVLYHRRFRDRQSQIFALMGILMLLWVDFAYLARLVGVGQIPLSEIYLRVAWVATPLLFYFTYLTSIYVIQKEMNYKIVSIVLLLFAAFLSFATAFTNLIIEGVKFTNGNLDIIYGVGFYPFLFVIFIFMVSTLVPLFRGKLTKSSSVFLVGVIIFYVANLIFNIALPVFLGVTYLYYLGDYSTIFLLGFTAYAIIQHELFDIKVIVTEALTVVIWIVLFTKLFVSQSITEAVIDIFTLGLVVIFGIWLIRSVIREVHQRERLQELTGKLKELDKQKDEFISMAAHELRSPMTAIKGYISMILHGDTGDIPEKARGYLADANAINDRTIRLVNNMLNVSRIEEGRMVYQLEVENLSRVARAVFASFAPEAERKGLKYSLQIPPAVKDTVEVDPDRIHEVVGNLISNAIKYTEKGSVTVLLSQPKNDSVRLEVVDTGRGISKKEQEKLFRKFYRAETAVGKTMGTGLGLYISKLLVERFNGKIDLISDPGAGSTFWFELPLAGTGDYKNKPD